MNGKYGCVAITFAYPFPLHCELRMSRSHAFVLALGHFAIVSVLSLQIMATNASWLAQGMVSSAVQFNVSYVDTLSGVVRSDRQVYQILSCCKVGYGIAHENSSLLVTATRSQHRPTRSLPHAQVLVSLLSPL